MTNNPTPTKAMQKSLLHIALLAWKAGDIPMVDLKKLIEAHVAQACKEARIDENKSMKEAVSHGYTWSGQDHCYNHDRHVSQCYACREAKWGNIFCQKFEAIIDERLATPEGQEVKTDE